ncbi:MAG: M23 family metallopeptidase [bacterium]
MLILWASMGVIMVFAVLMLVWRANRSPAKTPPPVAITTNSASLTNAALRPILSDAGFPTPQTNLLAASPAGIFMPTAAGNPNSGLFGSVRTHASGAAQFHEGIDIAPFQRGHGGKALDEIFAIADGTLAYLNRTPGNSNYGRYLVLLHGDPLGEVYTLYAHLADFTPGLTPGQRLRRGAVLGRMGNSSSSAISVERSHLHFEIGLLLNRRFEPWFHAQRLTPDHGIWNGWNLTGVDPLAFYRARDEDSALSFARFIDRIPAAFEIILRTRTRPEYFGRYSGLWKGPAETGGAIVVRASENGLPLGGRPATPAEANRLGHDTAQVLSVNAATLGRNGAHLIASKNGVWSMAKGGEQWRQILLYPQP